MPSTDSDELGKVVDMPLERVVGMARNEWTASIGIDGRHGPDYAIRTWDLRVMRGAFTRALASLAEPKPWLRQDCSHRGFFTLARRAAR